MQVPLDTGEQPALPLPRLAHPLSPVGRLDPAPTQPARSVAALCELLGLPQLQYLPAADLDRLTRALLGEYQRRASEGESS